MIGLGMLTLLQIWDVRNKTCLGAFQGHIGGILGLSFSVDGTEIASASTDCTVC